MTTSCRGENSVVACTVLSSADYTVGLVIMCAKYGVAHTIRVVSRSLGSSHLTKYDRVRKAIDEARCDKTHVKAVPWQGEKERRLSEVCCMFPKAVGFSVGSDDNTGMVTVTVFGPCIA
jgi:hypothetical protein